MPAPVMRMLSVRFRSVAPYFNQRKKNNNMNDSEVKKIIDLVTIVQSTCPKEFFKFQYKILKYMIQEFSIDYSVENITKVMFQFYNQKDDNIVIQIRTALKHNEDDITLFLAGLVGYIFDELNKKYNKNLKN